ncbi:MAG: DUF4359 domain-containing protein [Cyanobacteriota bacterium]|nr:DUF4359 domain-containing protein [Cyanobacteriota bacterium]
MRPGIALNPLQVVSALAVSLAAGCGVLLALNNPGQRDYERYAAESLSFYLKDRVCPQAPLTFNGALQSYCKTLVDASRPQITTVVARSTSRQNFLLFSVYETRLLLPAPLPGYQFQTLGIMGEFYTYDAQAL